MNIYKTLNYVRTHLIVWGDPFEAGGSDVIVCITGSPGITEFYREFGEELHINTGLPVCVIGHAGQDKIPKQEKTNSTMNLFGIQGQIDHKLDLIKNHVDKKSKLHLIGHSIGAWLLVELLQKNDYLLERVVSINLLFPTLQRMTDTKMGVFLNNVVRKINQFVLLLLMLLLVLPKAVIFFLIDIYLQLQSLPSHYVKRVYLYLNPKIEENALQFAYECMDNINVLNYSAIDKIKHITSVIYSVKDHWVPMHHIEDLKRYQPHLKLRELNVDHAFVLKSSTVVAQNVVNLIKSKF